ncbi:unnamed protein product [Mesocestoides corti]|uniref:ANK_REP_REGION domain-containing protein n=1 Tax=Mesocestoides corti TaxID=53468 RepID=A0A0R3U4G8_MESCO|nr:unnamed protein product [Mesocestoides corti]
MNSEIQIFPSVENSAHFGSQNFLGSSKASGDTSITNTYPTLPKYYPEDHELTKWMINQMRRRNGLHHLINFANSHPFILSAYFEVLDQPDKYISSKEASNFPAYSSKTILFLTPLAMAVYFGCKSVIRILLDESGARLQSRARSNVDMNATCYARRIKPRHGILGFEDYFTTSPAVLALRREFYFGLNLLMIAGFNPHDRIQYMDHVASPSQKVYCITDLVEYALRLMISRPGFDIIHLLQYLTYPNPSGKCAYDVMTYDVYLNHDEEKQTPIWFSFFRRICRRGITPAYTNCANRMIDILEILENLGFFKQDIMPHGPVAYSIEPGRSPIKRHHMPQRVTPVEIRSLQPAEATEAMRAIAIDRDECFAFLIIWLTRMKNRCLTKPYQRLTKILLSGLVATRMLDDFLVPPPHIDPKVTLWPQWVELGTGLNQQVPNTNWKSCQEEINIFSDDAFESYYLEPIQVHELRMELKRLAIIQGFVDEKLVDQVRESRNRPKSSSSPNENPVTAIAATDKPRQLSVSAVFTTECHLVTDEGQQSCSNGPNTPSEATGSLEIVPRSRRISQEFLNQSVPTDQGDMNIQTAGIHRLIEQTNISNNLSRPNTTKPTQDMKPPVRRRPRSAKTIGFKSIPMEIKQKHASSNKKAIVVSKPLPRWRI